MANLVVLYASSNKQIQPDKYTMDYIEKQIAARAQAYLSAGGYDRPGIRFFGEWKNVLPRIQIQFLTWEDVLVEIDDHDLHEFYKLCKQFN